MSTLLKKYTAVLIGLLLLCLMAAACAEDIAPLISASQMKWYGNEVSGLSASSDFANGSYGFTINSEETQWGTVAAYYGGRQYMELNYAVSAPNAQATHFVRAVIFKKQADVTAEDIEKALATELEWLYEQKPLSVESQGGLVRIDPVIYATYLAAQQTVFPETPERTVAIRWYDAAGNVLGLQTMDVVCKHSDRSTQPVTPAVVPEERIASDNDLGQYSKGTLTYRLAKQEMRPTTTVVTAPETENATVTNCVVNGLDIWHSNPENSDNYYFDNGCVTLVTQPGEKMLSLTWYAGDELLLCESLTIHTLETGADVWPVYIPDWKRANIISIATQQLDGVMDRAALDQDAQDAVITYQYLSSDAGKADFSASRVLYTIQQPAESEKKAAWVFPYLLGCENIHNSTHAAFDRSEYSRHTDDWQTVTNGTYVFEDKVFRELLNTPEIRVYQPALNNEEDYGLVVALYWIDGEGNLLDISWLTIQSEDLFTMAQQDPVQSEDELDGPVEDVTVIDPEMSEWLLVSQYLPQNGKNAYHVELHLTDEEGWICQPGKNMIFYLPYPEGHSYQGPYQYWLRHYTVDHSNYELVKLEATPHGLRFMTKRLSPFVVGWEDTQPAAEQNVPQTGDRTPLALLGVLLMLSAACMAAKRRIFR